MPSKTRNLKRNRRAASPAVSMVIITAATVVLVLVSSSFALQILGRQQGGNEFDVVRKSLLTFDDAFRDIAFDRGGSRSVRFTTQYGYMSLLANEEDLVISVTNYPQVSLGISTGVIKYSIPTSYVTYGNGYSSYVLGNNQTCVSLATDTLGRISATQPADFLTLRLDYRVRVTTEGPSISIGGTSVTYVDILVMRMNITKSLNVNGGFDLVAKNLDVTTTMMGPYDVTSNCEVVVGIGEDQSKVAVPLSSDKVVFNLILADIKVGV